MTPKESDLIESKTIPDLGVTASLYQTPHRPSGKRIVARDAVGRVVFDSQDCYDLANAEYALSRWMQIEQVKLGKKIA